MIALLGFPPFSLFASELAIARAGVVDGLGWVVAVALVLLLVIFAAIVVHAQQMLLGEPGADVERSPHRPSSPAVPLVAGPGRRRALGVSIWPIDSLLHDAATHVVTG